MGFVYYFSLSCLAALLLTTGGAHLAGFSAFRALLYEHNLVSSVTSAAVFILVVELTIGMTALLLLVGGLQTTVAPPLFAASASVGVVFLMYVRRLLRHATSLTSCGCSPLSSPLTPASLLPAATLALVSGAGFVANLLSAADHTSALANEYGLALYTLPVLSGIVFAGITMLIPASMPLPVTDTKEHEA